MKAETPIYSVREFTSLIFRSKSQDDMDAVRQLLIREIEKYELADQGFLMAITGMQMMKVMDHSRALSRSPERMLISAMRCGRN